MLIIFESDSLLVIDKPAGLIVHSDGRTDEPTVADWILARYPALADVGGPWISPQGIGFPCPGIVHRLDRTTSGIMVIAKTNEMYAYLKDVFRKRIVRKTYYAIVEGDVRAQSGLISAEIVRIATAPRRWAALERELDHKRTAITEWNVVKRGFNNVGEALTALEASPKTGRTHQIRVHMASVGHPVLGDALYGRASSLISRPALHAAAISLPLPDGTMGEWRAEEPQDMRILSDSIFGYA